MISTDRGKFVFNGKRKDFVWGRSSFKLSNIITYHFTGQGGGKYSLGSAQRWVEYNQGIFGEDVLLRVFLETAGWHPCSDCMFGSEPRDQGFWEREALRDGVREQEMHPVGKQVLEWFFKISQETGVAFELIIDATLKHDGIPKGEIDHVIRVTGTQMGEYAQLYPKALIIPNMRNEWNAHNGSGHTLQEVNMWAVRWDRDGYWPGAPKIVDPGGQNFFDYDVGPEERKYRAGMIHPERDEGWEKFPNPEELARLRRDARGMPVGFTESMYYVEPEDVARATRWYDRGWTSDWSKYEQFLQHVEVTVDSFNVHDEKGVQCDSEWPRKETRVEAWARAKFGGTTPPPEPPPPQRLSVRRSDEKELVIERDPEVVKGGSEEFVLVDDLGVMLPAGRKLERLHVFHGRDQDDLAEMDTEIHANGKTLYTRSDHRVTAYDAWDVWDPTDFGEELRNVEVHVICRVTGKNGAGKWEARPHWGIRFVWK